MEGFPERDRRRHPVEMSALLHVPGKRRRIKISDRTPRGLRVEQSTGIWPGERVTVELRCGMRLPMIVAWVKGTSAGLRFLGPVAPGHPVLGALQEAASESKLSR